MGAASRLAAAALVLSAAPALAERSVPPLTGPVVDEAGLLDARSRRALEALSRAARAERGGHGVQLQYLVVRSLDGEPIEEFANRVGRTWALGSRKEENGILVVVSTEDRQVRIEVAGLEGSLTDVQAGRIIRYTVVPAFREARYGEGLYDAGIEILATVGGLPRDLERDRQAARPAVGSALFTLLVIAIFAIALFFRIASGFGLRRRRFWGGGYGEGWWGGGLGGGGGWTGGGGGWSGGGGGGWSGGGASGRW